MKAKYLLIKLFIIQLFLSHLSSIYAQTRTLDTSLKVGTIEGTPSVTPTGAANYEIPIKIAAGTSAMAPKLSITYNSQAGDGLLGLGFTITGLSSISRCPADKYHDGVFDPVDFDSNDRFVLDGNRLILVSGTYGTNSSEYRTENNIFSKVIAYGNTGAGPEKFMVWTKSGLIQEYGYTADSRIEAEGKTYPMYWLLNKVTDTNGNYYTITYTEDNYSGSYRPSRIDYTGNTTITPALATYCSIRFGYASRLKSSLYFQAGSQSFNDYLLDNIKVYYGESVVKEYKLTYSTNTVRYNHNLTSVQEIGLNGEKYNTTIFKWMDSSDFGQQKVNTVTSDPYLNYNSNFTLGDFNGDGQTDIIVTPIADLGATWTGYKVYLCDKDGKKFYNTISDTLPSNFSAMHSGDFNGDGLSDIFVLNTDGSSYVAYSNGTNFIYCSNPYKIFDNFVFGDFDGDGKTEILALSNKDNYWKDWTIFKFYDGFNTSDNFPRIVDPKDKDFKVGDFDGDGLSDIAVTSDSITKIYTSCGSTGSRFNYWGSLYPTKEHKFGFGDFNADSKTDILVYGDRYYTYGNLEIHLSDGTGFKKYTDASGFALSDWPKMFFYDFSGDGKTDFVYYLHNQIQLNTRIVNNTGMQFYSPGIQGGTSGTRIYIGNFAGSGKAGYFCVDDKAPWWNGYEMYHTRTNQNDLMYSVTDGLNNEIKFTYKPATDNRVYAKQSNAAYPVNDMEASMPLVDSLIVPDGIGGSRVTKYKYEGAKLHKLGKGFLGFAKFTVTDCQTGIYTATNYEIEPTTYFTAEKRSETRTSDGKLLSETDNVNSLKQYQTGVYTYLPSSVTEKKYEPGASTSYTITTTSYTYDNYGNVVTANQAFGANNSVLTTHEYTNDVTKWHLGRLTKAIVTKKSTGSSDIIRKTQFTYDPTTGLLLKEIVEPGDSLSSEKVYERDVYGNITKSTTTSGGVSRYLRTVYDNKGRFSIKTYNAFEQRDSLTIDPLLGNVLSQTGPNNLTTTSVYDGLGMLVQTTNPDNTFAKVTYSWCDGSTQEPSGAVYYSQSEASGTPPVFEYFDRLGRMLRKVVTGFDGKKIFTDIEYNARGQVWRTSDPYFQGETQLWTTNTYDALGRVIKKVMPDNSEVTINYNGLTISTTGPGNNYQSRTLDHTGNIVKVSNLLKLNSVYSYNSAGNLVKITKPGGDEITMEYDILGNRTKLVDPELGTITSKYNGFGELVRETDAKSQTMYMEYDALGRLKKRTEKEGVTQWVYDTQPKGIGKLTSVSGPNGISQLVEYDEFGRVSNQSEIIDGITYTTATTYDAYSRVDKITYPKYPHDPYFFVVEHKYNQYGYLEKVKDVNGTEFWTAQKMNARGQLEQVKYGYNLQSTFTYNTLTGTVQNIKTPGIQDWSYTFNSLGNLMQRKDNSRGLTEDFGYDIYNRLEKVLKNGTQSLAMTYDKDGNILTKSDVGKYIYDSGNKTVVSIEAYPGTIYNYEQQNITYTSFDKVRTIWQGADSLILTYGTSYERKIADVYKNRVLKTRRHYVGSIMETEQDYTSGQINITYYIFAGSTSVAVKTRNSNGGGELLYLFKDHLGSTQYITDEYGNLKQELSYDAWGNRRDPATWKVYSKAPAAVLARGYTGHEHLDLFELINMNGRVYDPALGRFLSPDPFIQDIYNPHCLNRYAYCVNNPLSLTDPTGYNWVTTVIAVAVGITVTALTAGTGSGIWAVIIPAAAGGFAGGFTNAILSGQSFGDALKAGVVGGIISGVSGVGTFGIGEVQYLIPKVVFHSYFQGTLSVITGGKFEHGFYSAAFTGAASPYITSAMGNSKAGQLIGAAVIGGTAAEISGGKFANGAITGAYQMMFNYFQHEYLDKQIKQRIDRALEQERVRTIAIQNKKNEMLESGIPNTEYDYNEQYIEGVNFEIPGIKRQTWDTGHPFNYQFNGKNIQGVYIPGKGLVRVVDYSGNKEPIKITNYGNIIGYAVRFRTQGNVDRAILIFQDKATYQSFLSQKIYKK
jgi:RHS repeat-associated protein